MPNSRSVLVLTNPFDVTTDVVLKILAERAVPVVRLDPGTDLQAGALLTARFDAGGQGGTLRTSTRELDLRHVRSVWVRRPSPYRGPDDLDPRERRFIADQTNWGAGGILASLRGAHYVNHPWANRNAESKPSQLATAHQVGLRTPSTIITNDPDEAREFVTLHSSGAVYKPLWNTAYTTDDGTAQTVWVREVTASEITDAISACPHMFQAKVRKAFDARVTVVGDALFGIRIDSPDLDWREQQNLMHCEPVPVPDDVTHAIRRYMKARGLVFGAFDFAVTDLNHWYFLECNPNGQWAWQPEDTTNQVAHALADQLEKGPTV
ncbi:ATP-grasp ribosomal peptide maturase [Kitasatospora phosalacinea]|uniref:ATP-grasp ribosomal peptide maturase n=1 Tax=Kitasatospora phosalacinea TaxID=2065 RepID=A0A9W6PFE4_9ACTN|nr:ATP-grasp ribosomal peptide maturase [Kitasatospora phosalacinea]GLW53989.1 ATP-grasp ribosomal peptide maturase [Kitasatospora phosalacinea]